MNTIVKKIGVILITLVPPACIAENTKDCVYLEVILTNQAASACTLYDAHLVHGKLASNQAIPSLLAPLSQHHFFLRQTHFGPDIILSYSCNQKRVTFESKQGVCLFAAGTVKGAIIKNEGVMLKNHKKSGSSWLGRQGQIIWNFK